MLDARPTILGVALVPVVFLAPAPELLSTIVFLIQNMEIVGVVAVPAQIRVLFVATAAFAARAVPAFPFQTAGRALSLLVVAVAVPPLEKAIGVPTFKLARIRSPVSAPFRQKCRAFSATVPATVPEKPRTLVLNGTRQIRAIYAGLASEPVFILV